MPRVAGQKIVVSRSVGKRELAGVPGFQPDSSEDAPPAFRIAHQDRPVFGAEVDLMRPQALVGNAKHGPRLRFDVGGRQGQVGAARDAGNLYRHGCRFPAARLAAPPAGENSGGRSVPGGDDGGGHQRQDHEDEAGRPSPGTTPRRHRYSASKISGFSGPSTWSTAMAPLPEARLMEWSTRM